MYSVSYCMYMNTTTMKNIHTASGQSCHTDRGNTTTRRSQAQGIEFKIHIYPSRSWAHRRNLVVFRHSDLVDGAEINHDAVLDGGCVWRWRVPTTSDGKRALQIKKT